MSSVKNRFKVVVLGEGCVGKTSCLARFIGKDFNAKHVTTIQVFGCSVISNALLCVLLIEIEFQWLF
jgi:GTPase SAR1 family protein